MTMDDVQVMDDLLLHAAVDMRKLPAVSILAYFGGIMRVPGWGDIVIDLAGLDTSDGVAILSDHDSSRRGVVGHGRAEVTGKRKHIRPRFGAVGKYGSLAVIERFIRTLKDECTRRIVVPLRRRDMRRELTCHLGWYNEHRPHEYLGGRTPNEVYHDRPAASEMPRIEVRPHWPRGASCAAPTAAIDGDPGQKVVLVVSYHAGRKNLPVVKLKRVA